jgi:hypothetical protein
VRGCAVNTDLTTLDRMAARSRVIPESYCTASSRAVRPGPAISGSEYSGKGALDRLAKPSHAQLPAADWPD